MSIFSFLGSLVDPTNQYKSYSHQVFSQSLVWVITLVVGNVTTLGFLGLGLMTTGWLFSLYDMSTVTNSWFLSFLGIWALVEVWFYFYCLTLKQKLEAPMTFPSLSRMQKEFILDKVLDTCADPRGALVRWFHLHPPEDVGLEGFRIWLSWAFFGKLYPDLSEQETEELDMLVEKTIQKCPNVVEPSSKTQLNFMRLHLDEVAVQHKPFVAYVVSLL